jgi:hypothetical protein
MSTEVAEIGKIKVEEFKALLATAPAILEQNRSSEFNAVKKGNELIELAKNGMTDELDTLIADFVEKGTKTITGVNNKRSPITQSLTMIAKEFTSIEANIKKVVDECKDYRNEYATKKMKERQEAERLAAIKLAKEQEAIELEKNYKIAFGNAYSDYVLKFKQTKLNWFDSLTLETIDAAFVAIGNFDNNLSDGTFMFDVAVPELRFHTASEYNDIVPTMQLCYQYLNSFKSDMQGFKKELLDMIPSKKTQLEELEKARLEELRLKAEEAERQRILNEQMEAARKAAEQADEANKARLQEEARQAKLKADAEKAINDAAEAKRKAEADKIAEEERQRKEQADIQLKTEALQAQLKAEADASVQASGQTAAAFVDTQANLFDSAPKVKEGYEIKILNPAAYLQIAQFWYENEGRDLPMDKIESMTIGRMKAFAEKWAIKTGDMIVSKLIVYEPVYKAK